MGVNYGGITRCYATGPIRRFMGFASGGLVGFNIGVITDCYATGTVFGMGYSNYGPFTSGYIGGLVGCDNRGTITSCYAIGVVLGNGNDTTTGGLIGCKWSGSTTTTASFWDTQTSGQTTSVGGTGKTTAEMKTLSTFTSAGWDFADIWGIGENQTYPFLRKYSLGDLNYDGIVNFVDFALFADGWFEGVQ